MTLVSLYTAIDHLRETPGANDFEVAGKLAQAEVIVLDYIDKPGVDWAMDARLPIVQAAILLVLGALYDGTEEVIGPSVTRLLLRIRDPSLA